MTERAGVGHVGRSFGASAGDFDGDGWPDLFVGNHYHSPTSSVTPSLFRNLGDGTFADVSAATLEGNVHGDLHGAAFADFDNDGDQDLAVCAGADFGRGACPKLFFRNDRPRARLVEIAASIGVDAPECRGRTPLWCAWNEDARLELLWTALRRDDDRWPSTLFEWSEPGGFTPLPVDVTGKPAHDCLYAQTADLDGDGSPELLLHGWPGPQILQPPPRKDGARTPVRLPIVYDLSDSAIADFDGDLLPDVLLVQEKSSQARAEASSPHRLDVAFVVKAKSQSIRFKCASDRIEVRTSDAEPVAPRVTIGASRRLPRVGAGETFAIARDDVAARPRVAGESPSERTLRCGYDPTDERWWVAAASPDWWGPFARITADHPIEDVELDGFPEDLKPPDAVLLVHRSKTELVKSERAGAALLGLAARSVASGDFDNDGDVDLFVVQSTRLRNLPDVLLLNRGDGAFDRAAADMGAGGTETGSGDTAVVLDFDRDGFLDLFVTNGEGESLESAAGSNRLFRNLGNGNHWFEIDLIGTASNRDAIGARVVLTAGGVARLREQGGGMHRFSQDSQRLHFGLGAAREVERIEVTWPSGTRQELSRIAADQVLAIEEPARPAPK